jgi:hypothetical protein
MKRPEGDLVRFAWLERMAHTDSGVERSVSIVNQCDMRPSRFDYQGMFEENRLLLHSTLERKFSIRVNL